MACTLRFTRICQSIGKFTKYCNETLDSGVTPAQLIKRLLRPDESVEDAGLKVWFAISLAVTVTITLACIVTGAVLTRPRMQPFNPTISTVRMEPLIKLVVFGWSSHTPKSLISQDTMKVLDARIKDVKEAMETCGLPAGGRDIIHDSASGSKSDISSQLKVIEFLMEEEPGTAGVKFMDESEELPQVRFAPSESSSISSVARKILRNGR